MTSNLLLIFITVNGATPVRLRVNYCVRCGRPGPPFQKEWTMPGQEIVVTHAHDGPGEGHGVPAARDRDSRRPIVPGSIALLAALAFVLARWQTWAKGDITRFILVGRHFATPSQLPRGVAVAPTYGYDGQFFYRLALNPVNFSHIAYGIRVDQPYRYMRIGYPWLTWLVSFGQHVLVPVILVVINIVAIGAIGYLGGMFARQGGRHALAGLVLPAYFGLLDQPVEGHGRAPCRRLPARRAAGHPGAPTRARWPAAGLRRADQGIGHGRRGRRGHRRLHRRHPPPTLRAARARRPGPGPSDRSLRGRGRSW